MMDLCFGFWILCLGYCGVLASSGWVCGIDLTGLELVLGLGIDLCYRWKFGRG